MNANLYLKHKIAEKFNLKKSEVRVRKKPGLAKQVVISVPADAHISGEALDQCAREAQEEYRLKYWT